MVNVNDKRRMLEHLFPIVEFTSIIQIPFIINQIRILLYYSHCEQKALLPYSILFHN